MTATRALTVDDAPAPDRSPATGTARRRRGSAALVVAGFAGALVLALLGSLAVGARSVAPGTVVDALLHADAADPDHLVVRELRLPRTVAGLVVGVALGLSGAVMQALTRNPLADPGILGVNAGASLAVVLALSAFQVGSTLGLVWFALAGAALASVVVFLLGSVGRSGATPVRLALAGAATTALLSALTRAVTLLDQATLDEFRFWAVGSLTGRGGEVLASAGWFVLAGVVLTAGLARSLDALALGDDAALALGVRTGRVRLLAGGAIVLMCGAAVAAVGPIGFVGLVVPHAVRALTGPDQRRILLGSALLGPALLLGCDTVGRVIAPPGEVQVGIATALIGGPVFVALVRRTRTVAA